MSIVLVTGGVRSGKSRFAQELAEGSKKTVLFVATATGGDEEMRRRIEEHRKQRPGNWRTLEAGTHVGRQVRKNISDAQLVIIDCITLLVNNIFTQHTGSAGDITDAVRLEKQVTEEISELIGGMDRVAADFVIVTNEVGLGIIPENRMGRLYEDLLGKANRLLVERADEVYLMVAGIAVKIKPAR